MRELDLSGTGYGPVAGFFLGPKNVGNFLSNSYIL
jgi:hypothetical protein